MFFILNKKNLIIRNLLNQRFLHNGNIPHYVSNYYKKFSLKKFFYIFKLDILNSFKNLWNLKYKKFSISKKLKFFFKLWILKKTLNKRFFFENKLKKKRWSSRFNRRLSSKLNDKKPAKSLSYLLNLTKELHKKLNKSLPSEPNKSLPLRSNYKKFNRGSLLGLSIKKSNKSLPLRLKISKSNRRFLLRLNIKKFNVSLPYLLKLNKKFNKRLFFKLKFRDSRRCLPFRSNTKIFKEQISLFSKFKNFNKQLYLWFFIIKKINFLFLRLSLFLNKCNIFSTLSSQFNDVRLLTSLVFKTERKTKFLQDVKFMYFILNKKVYFFNNVNTLPFSFYDFFNKSFFYFSNLSLNRSNINVKNLYIKFFNFFFLKFGSSKLRYWRKIWKLRFFKKARLSKFKKVRLSKFKKARLFQFKKARLSKSKKARLARKARWNLKKLSNLYLFFPLGFQLRKSYSPLCSPSRKLNKFIKLKKFHNLRTYKLNNSCKLDYYSKLNKIYKLTKSRKIRNINKLIKSSKLDYYSKLNKIYKLTKFRKIRNINKFYNTRNVNKIRNINKFYNTRGSHNYYNARNVNNYYNTRGNKSYNARGNKSYNARGSHYYTRNFSFRKPYFFREMDFWGFKRNLRLSKKVKAQMKFFYRSRFLQYSKISRLQDYFFTVGTIFDRLYLVFFLQLIYYFINNSIRYFKFVSIIDTH